MLKTPKAEISRKVAEVADILQISHKLDNKATALSGGQGVALDLQGCDAARATFAVSHVRLADATQAGAALAGWQAATLANLRAANPATQAFGIPDGQLGVRWAVQGQRADGRPVSAQAVWFARIRPQGIDLFNAVVLADKADTAVADTFFTGLKFE